MLVKAASQQMQALLQREWLDANQRGSFSSSTILDCPTRRYHGLLVSDAGYLPDKYNFLAKMEASLTHRGRTIDLFTNKHPNGTYFPEGHNHFEYFRYERFPAIGYRVGPFLIERSLCLLYEADVLLIRYRMLEGDSAQLTLRPLLAYRSFHHLRQETAEFQVKTYPEGEAWKIEPLPGKPPLYFGAARSVQFFPGPYWVKQVEYTIEQERGFDYQEDLFCPGIFEAALSPADDLIFAVGLKPSAGASLRAAWDGEDARRRELAESFASSPSPQAELKYEAEKFLVRRSDGSLSVTAGYHWFGEWGRDAMIALPGLTLARQQPERLIEVVRTFLAQAQHGLIPNFLGSGTAPANYASIDAVFWMFTALDAYRSAGCARAPLKDLYPKLETLLLDLAEGRCPVARVDEQGLLYAGNRSSQLTWMDAKVNGMPVTPRSGLAVEVNALWFNAVGFLFELAQEIGAPFPPRLTRVLESFARAFRQKFWLSEAGYLADTVDQNQVDASLRPNQIFAVSVPRSALSLTEQRSIMHKVSAQLLTPVGLRTLAPREPAFEPFYQGGSAQRDRSYHQGTVWPWLLYHYAVAMLRVSEDAAQTKHFLKQNLEYLWTDHLTQAGIMGISEIFDAYPPYAPNGCITQAWSVAEIIRLMDLLELS